MAAPDKQRIAARFAAAAPHYDRHAEAQRIIHGELEKLLCAHAPSEVRKILEIGCGTGLFSRILARRYPEARLVLNDLNAACAPFWQEEMPSEIEYRFGDVEQTGFCGGCDIIASASALQWLADPAAFLHRAAAGLNSDGLLLFNTFTAGNLYPVRELTGSGLHYPSARQWAQWLAQDYEISALYSRTITLAFDTPRDVLRHLKHTGVTATASGFVWTKRQLQDFENRYGSLHALSDGRVGLDYTPLYAAARKR